MAKSARASVIKKNKSGLKKRVFGPVEAARNARMNAKLLELANQPKPPRAEMEVEREGTKDSRPDGQEEKSDADATMEVDEIASTRKSRKASKDGEKRKKSGRIGKTKHRRERNNIAFKKHPMKSAKRSKKG